MLTSPTSTGPLHSTSINPFFTIKIIELQINIRYTKMLSRRTKMSQERPNTKLEPESILDGEKCRAS